VERFRLFLSRPIEGKIKTVTIRRASAVKWFVSFSCDGVPEKRLAPTGKEVGIDVGIKALCVDSETRSSSASRRDFSAGASGPYRGREGGLPGVQR